MQNYFFVTIVGLLLAMAAQANAQKTDFFWSAFDLNMGTKNGPVVLFPKSVGDSGSLFLYYTTGGPTGFDLDVGAFLDIATSRDGVIKFTDAQTYDFPIEVIGVEVGRRWFESIDGCPESFGQTGNVTDNFINEWGGFTVTANGIAAQNTGPLFTDAGYDLSADAFLFGRVDFEVVGSGCVQIYIGRGQKGIGRRINEEFLWGELFEPTFGSALINVGLLVRGDLNNDGVVAITDVAPFVQQLADSEYSPESDTNCDGQLSLLDVAPFVDLLSESGNTYKVVDPSIENMEPKFDRLGDTTDDGFIDMLDVACFRQIGNDCGAFANTDINGDGSVDLLDLCPFVDLILNQANK